MAQPRLLMIFSFRSLRRFFSANGLQVITTSSKLSSSGITCIPDTLATWENIDQLHALLLMHRPGGMPTCNGKGVLHLKLLLSPTGQPATNIEDTEPDVDLVIPSGRRKRVTHAQ
jgi:hypothetical protein